MNVIINGNIISLSDAIKNGDVYLNRASGKKQIKYEILFVMYKKHGVPMTKLEISGDVDLEAEYLRIMQENNKDYTQHYEIRYFAEGDRCLESGCTYTDKMIQDSITKRNCYILNRINDINLNIRKNSY